MAEARVVCLCNSYRIEDLGLDLSKGQVHSLSEEKARGSKDLQRAWRAQAVSVQYLDRSAPQSAPRSSSVTTPVPISPFREEMTPDSLSDRFRKFQLDVEDLVRLEVHRQVKALGARLQSQIEAVLLEARRLDEDLSQQLQTQISTILSRAPISENLSLPEELETQVAATPKRRTKKTDPQED